MSNYYAADVIQFFADNWVWILCGWLAISLGSALMLAILDRVFPQKPKREGYAVDFDLIRESLRERPEQIVVSEPGGTYARVEHLQCALSRASSDPTPRDTVFGHGTFVDGIFVPTATGYDGLKNALDEIE